MVLKKKIRIFIIAIILICIFILYIINGFYFRSKQEQIMEQFGEAICNKDIDLLDSLVSSDCTVRTIDGKMRNYYSYQRFIIERSWNTESYSITGYYYLPFSRESEFWNSMSAMNVAYMIITDPNGKEYELSLVVTIHRTSLSNVKITRWSGSLDER